MRSVRNYITQDDIDTYTDLMDGGQEADFARRFLGLYSTEQYQLYRALGGERQKKLFDIISPEAFAPAFKAFARDEQLELFARMDEEYRIRVLERLSTDDLRYFMEPMTHDDQEALLSEMSDGKASHMRELLEYEKHSAGSIMRKEFVIASPDDTAKMAAEQLKTDTSTYEAVHFIYITDNDQRLVGLLSLRDLLVADASSKLGDICQTDVITVPVDMDQEQVGHIMQDYDVIAVPVVNGGDELVGLITVDDIIDVMEFEATEDVGELSASRGSTDVSVSPFVAARKRAPWIVLLMFLGLITANVIGAFEETLEAVVLLSFFIPLVMDAAGNTGTQSLAVMVRTLSTGAYEQHGIWRTLKRELGAGMLVGLASGITIVILISIFYQELWLAVVVGVSLLLTLSVATVIGSITPIIINKLKIDPAVASGPFITTLNDIIGLAIYFTIATTLLQI